MTLWAIEWRRNGGDWYVDHTTVRTTRREAWAQWCRWWRDPNGERRKRQRKGAIRAVKVRVMRAESSHD